MIENKQTCMHCHEFYDRDELIWINDNYGIPYKKVCDKCYDEVEAQIRGNNYGDELSHDELYGEDDLW